MTLVFINTNLPRWSLDTLLWEPYREGGQHFVKVFAKGQSETGPSLKQRIFHSVAAVFLLFPFANTVIYVALRFFYQRAPTQRPPANLPVPPPLEYEKRIKAATSLAHAEVRSLDDVTLQTEIDKFIAWLEFDILQLLRKQSDPKIALMIVENAEHELHCIAEQIRDIPPDGAAKIPVPSPEALIWQRNITNAMYSPADKEEFIKVIEEGRNKGFLNQKFVTFFGGTIFHQLAKKDSYLLFVTLLKGMPIDASLQDLWGNTGLIWACANASNGIAREILQIFGRNEYLDRQCFIHSNTALHLVVGKGYKDRSKDGKILACSNLELLQLLVLLKANVNLRNKEGNTPLHLAFLRRDKAMVEVLRGAGADTNILNHQGQKPSDLLKASYEEACRVLDLTVSVFLLDRAEFQENQKQFATNQA